MPNPLDAAGQGKAGKAHDGEAGQGGAHGPWDSTGDKKGHAVLPSIMACARRNPCRNYPLVPHCGKALVNEAARAGRLDAAGSTVPSPMLAASRPYLPRHRCACFSFPWGLMPLWWAMRDDIAPNWGAADWSSAKLPAGGLRGASGHRGGLCGAGRALARHLRTPYLGGGEGGRRTHLYPLRQGRLGQPGAHQRLGAGRALVRQCAPSRGGDRRRRKPSG